MSLVYQILLLIDNYNVIYYIYITKHFFSSYFGIFFTYIYKNIHLSYGKNEILYKSFQVILSKKMHSENQEAIYFEDDGEYRVYCNNCDNICIERFFKNHLKSSTHSSNNRKRRNKNQQAYKN